MSRDERIALTLYDRMFEVITGSDPSSGLPPAFNSNETMFVMAAKGMVLKASDFENPWSPGNTSGSIDAAARIAALADDIPAVNYRYSPTGRTVSDVYPRIVNLVHVTEPPPSPTDQQRRDELNAVLVEHGKDDEGRPVTRPTALADAERKAFADYQEAYGAYVQAFTNAQLRPDLRASWPITGPSLLAIPKRAYEDWGVAGRDQIASVKAQLSTLNDGQVARVFTDAQFRLKTFETNDGPDTFFRTTMMPTDWASADGSNWPKYKFEQSDFSSQFSAEATSWGAAAQVSVGLWSFGGGASSSDSQSAMSEETTDVRMSFRWRICPIYRKWMDETIFKLPNWDLGSLTGTGGISGAPDAMMPLIPAAMVIVRDVEITAHWSQQDASHIDSAVSGSANVGYGPFSVSGNYSHSSTSDRFAANRTGQGFSIPDIQILGLVCTRVPTPCPPK
jgi:hypothetical protein